MMSERCLFGADVPFVPQLDGNYVQIIQGTRSRGAAHGLQPADRRLDGRPPVGDNVRHWSGISTGRWEGETLVVDTRNFNDRLPSFAGAGNSRGKVVTERFTRTSNNRIEYAATVVDPQTFQDRIELSFPMVAGQGADLRRRACHEGNYSMRNSLAAARIDDEARRSSTATRTASTVDDVRSHRRDRGAGRRAGVIRAGGLCRLMPAGSR